MFQSGCTVIFSQKGAYSQTQCLWFHNWHFCNMAHILSIFGIASRQFLAIDPTAAKTAKNLKIPMQVNLTAMKMCKIKSVSSEKLMQVAGAKSFVNTYLPLVSWSLSFFVVTRIGFKGTLLRFLLLSIYFTIAPFRPFGSYKTNDISVMTNPYPITMCFVIIALPFASWLVI